MKTPREILLDQHRNVESKLAEIRAEDLAAMTRSTESVKAPSTSRLHNIVRKVCAGIFHDKRRFSLSPRERAGVRGNRINFGTMAHNFWRESILPWRRVWVGMAAVWLGIFALNFAAQTTTRITVAKAPATDSRVVLAAWRERRQMFAQLLGPVLPAAEAARKIPGPRSSLRVELMVV
jgi:hypothetical protein